MTKTLVATPDPEEPTGFNWEDFYHSVLRDTPGNRDQRLEHVIDELEKQFTEDK